MFAIFKKLSWFFKEQWQRYTLAILFLCLVNILEVIPPKLVGNAIDDMNNGNMTQEGVMKYVIYLLMVLMRQLSIWLLMELSVIWRRKLGRTETKVRVYGPFAENDADFL